MSAKSADGLFDQTLRYVSLTTYLAEYFRDDNEPVEGEWVLEPLALPPPKPKAKRSKSRKKV